MYEQKQQSEKNDEQQHTSETHWQTKTNKWKNDEQQQ